jgi:integrase
LARNRKPYISAKTFHEYQLNIATLKKKFGIFRLTEIDADMIRKFQRERMLEGCGPSGINHECSVLQQMLKRIGRWSEIAPDYQPLPLPKTQPGRIITETEKQRLFRIASSNSEWQAAYLFAVLSVNTTAGPKDVATLRMKDVDPEHRLLIVQPEGAKNIHRTRPVGLNAESLPAAEMALQRARRCGASEPDHYVFPFRIHRNLWDPTRHQTTFKTAWKKTTEAAQLAGLQMYDLRRTGITNLLSNPEISEETTIKIAGHVDRKMLKRYSYVRLDKIREAVDLLVAKPKPVQPATPRRSPPGSSSA